MKNQEREIALATLKEMTKEEIIAWLSSDIGMMFRPPRRSELLSARWTLAADAVQARRERNRLEPGIAAAIDRFHAAAREAKDHKALLAIAKEAEPYEKKWKAWLKEGEAIQKEEAKVDAMWDELQAEYDKSSPRRASPQGGSNG